MRKTTLVAIALGVASIGSVTLSVRRQAAAWTAAGGPQALPPEWRDAGRQATAWMFLRPDCRACRRHLQGVTAALAGYDDSTRARLVSRMVLVGGDERVLPGARTVPDSLRRAFGVHIAPTTWFVDGDGCVRRAWRGARDRDAWSDGLEVLAGRIEWQP
jgi:hypothetical protein